jgi:hypothetical protein
MYNGEAIFRLARAASGSVSRKLEQGLVNTTDGGTVLVVTSKSSVILLHCNQECSTFSAISDSIFKGHVEQF